MLDAFIILVCEPHSIDDFLYDRRLEKAMTLVLYERPMLSTHTSVMMPSMFHRRPANLECKVRTLF